MFVKNKTGFQLFWTVFLLTYNMNMKTKSVYDKCKTKRRHNFLLNIYYTEQWIQY